MTEIPGGFPKKVCPETFVSNHTGPIRIADDQMQRLLDALHGVYMKLEPKPEPAPIPAMPDNWVPPVDPPETYKQEYENCYRLWQAAVKDRAFLEKERNLNKDRICELEQEVKFLKSAEDTLKVQIECLKSNLDAANDRAHMAEGRAYSLMCDYNRCKKEAELEVERLKAQVPKERYSVWIEMNPKTMRWNAFPCAREGVMFDSTATKEETLQKCRDYGFEVVE